MLKYLTIVSLFSIPLLAGTAKADDSLPDGVCYDSYVPFQKYADCPSGNILAFDHNDYAPVLVATYCDLNSQVVVMTKVILCTKKRGAKS